MRLRSLAVLAVLAPGLAAPAAASPWTGTDDGCAAASLATCASAHVRYTRLGQDLAPALMVGHQSEWEAQAGVPVNGFRFNPLPGQSFNAGPAVPQILSIWWGDDGRPMECRPGGRDCRAADPATVAPEPVTMSLLATGLVGLAGAGIRRRRRETADPV